MGFRSRRNGQRKHPHGRGEDRLMLSRTLGTPETPPRAWGRQYNVPEGVADHGNTPTGVGKTDRPARKIACAWKHPHGRGEDPVLADAGSPTQETPPRAWGRRRSPRFNPGRHRNTPTGVGKTFVQINSIAQAEKHPHGRGEDTNILSAFVIPITTSCYFAKRPFFSCTNCRPLISTRALV